MKEVKAYIKPHKLAALTLALEKVKGLSGVSVIEARGFGRSKDNIGDYIPHLKVEIICSDDIVDEVVSTIEEAAHTGLKGDGIIYVTEVEKAVRIETGERNDKALKGC